VQGLFSSIIEEMSFRSTNLAATRRRSLLATFAVALLLTPSLAALEHPAHETPEAGLVHAEAAHPHAAPHLEQEEHSALESCAVCVQAGRNAMDFASHSWQLRAIETPHHAVDLVWSGRHEVGLAQPRGPPA
jgi:hypothetical protein